jgi:hypothetical protein
MPACRPTSSRFVARFSCFLCLICFLCLPVWTGQAQQRPADAADISRELLYHPAHRIEPSEQGLIFRAAQFTYRFDSSSGQWQVRREKNFAPAETGQAIKMYKTARLGTEYRFIGTSTDDQGTLEIRRGPEQDLKVEPFAPLVLWKRQQLAATWLDFLRQDAPSLTAEALAKDLEVADPEVADVADDGSFLWLAIRYSTSEGSVGIGTVVRLDPRTNEAKAYQPQGLATSSVTHVVAVGGALWLGTSRYGEGTIFVTQGLVRLDPNTGEVRSHLPQSSPLMGSIITALRAEGSLLWVATDAGMCRVTLPKEEWTCWRIVPTVRLAGPVPVSNRSGAPSGGQLPAGSYEVRWANAAFLEAITPDSIEGWVAAEDLEDYGRRNFDSNAYDLGNVSAGGITAMRLVAKPGGDPLAGAQVYRAPLERVGSPTAEGWQRVRAHVGWISRKDLEVTPIVQPASPGPAPPR